MTSKLVAAQREILKRKGLGEFIPVLNQLEGEPLFVLDGNAVGFMYVCNPSPGLMMNQQNILTELYKMPFPDDTLIQCSLVALPDVIQQLNGWAAVRGGRMNGEDQVKSDTLSAYQLQYLNRSLHEPLKPDFNELKIRDMQVWFSFRIPVKYAIPTSAEEEKISRIYREIYNKLEMMSLKPLKADADTWHYCMDRVLNPGSDPRWRDGYSATTPFKPLRDQLVEPGRKIDIDDNYVASVNQSKDSTQQRFFQTLSVSKFPEYMEFGAIYGLVTDWMHGNHTIHSPFIQTLTVLVPNQEKTKSEFVRYKAVTNNQAQIPIVLQFCPRLKDMNDDYLAMTRELEEGEKLLKCYLTFTVMESSEERVYEASEQLKSFFEGSKVYVNADNYVFFPSLMSSLPLCNDKATVEDLDRWELYSSKGAAFLTPMYGSWKGNTRNPVLTFVSREGQLVGIDLFKTSASYNLVVGATSGAGKSFGVGYTLMNYMGAGPTALHIHHKEALNGLMSGKYPLTDDGAQVFVVDVGRSYEGTAGQYDNSQFIDFGRKPTFTLNPFSFMTGATASNDDVIKVIQDSSDGSAEDGDDSKDNVTQTIMTLNLLKMMASEPGDIDSFQQAMMIKLIAEEYHEATAQNRVGSVTGFAKRCLKLGKEMQDKRISDIGHQLQPWCEDGLYGGRFSTELPPINFDARFIVLELEELKGTPHLQTVVLMSIIQAAQHAMFIKRDGRRRLFVLDEAWEYIKPDDVKGTGKHANNAFFSAFLEAAWRRFRKTNCAGICITQSFEDYYTSSVGRALANNSPWKWVMKQEPEAIEAMKKNNYFSTSDAEYERMKEIRTMKGIYSEMLIRFEGVQQIVRLYVDRKMELCFTTDSADRNKLWELTGKGYSYAEAIEIVYQREQSLKATGMLLAS